MMWEKKSLGVIADVYNGNSINADYKKKHFLGLAEGLPFIATKDVLSNGEIDYENGVKVPLDAGLKIAPADSVFVCAEGGSAGKKIAFVKEDVCFGNKLFCILPKKKELYSAKYIYYFCRSELFREQFFGELTGLIGGVSAKKFRNIECPIPPLPEQERIVSLLDAEFAKIDAIKANAEKQLQDAKALFQSALKDYLTPKEGWEEKTLGEIAADSADGPFGSNLKAVHYTTKPQVRIVQLSNIGEYGWKDENIKYTTFEHLKAISRSEVTPGDIVIAKMMPAGRAIICPNYEKKYVLSSDAIKIKLINGYNTKYILHYINSIFFNKQVLENVSGSGRIRTSLTKLRSYKLYIPDFTTQTNIANKVDYLLKIYLQLQSNFDTTVTLCNDLKQSILKDIFG